MDSDASYLTCPGSKSRAGGFFYLGNKDESIINGSILYLTIIIKNVIASAAESEIAALFLNARLAIPLRNALREMGHTQPPTKKKWITTQQAVSQITQSTKQKLLVE